MSEEAKIEETQNIPVNYRVRLDRVIELNGKPAVILEVDIEDAESGDIFQQLGFHTIAEGGPGLKLGGGSRRPPQRTDGLGKDFKESVILEKN